MDKSIFKVEFKKYISHNYVSAVLYALAFMIIELVILLALFFLTMPLNKNISAINNQYDFAIISNQCYENYDNVYKFDNIITLSNKSDKRINVNLYMGSSADKSSVITAKKDLKDNEIAISQKISQKLGLSEGDTIYVDLPIYDEPIQYYVAEITPYVWNYYNIKDSRDFSVAYIEYSSELQEKTIGKYVHFLSSDEKADFYNADLSYAEICDVKSELSSLQNTVNLGTVVALIAMIFFSFFYYFLQNKEIRDEVKKYIIDSFELIFIKKLYQLIHLIYVIIPTSIISLICCFLAYFGIVSYVIAIGTILLIIILLILMLRGGNKFEKAD